MSLLDLIRRNRTADVATAIPAIAATDGAETGVTVARIATIAVANPRIETAQEDDPAIAEISSPADPPVDPPDDVPDQYGHWSESEVLLCMERTRQFVRRGVPELIADELACRLVERDRQEDTRRSCAECRAFRNGGCVQGKQPVCGGDVEVLHRCRTFIEKENSL